MSSNFNQILTLGYEFDQILIPGTIPQSVTHLTFGRYLNQCLKDIIPPSITHLTLSIKFIPEFLLDIPLSTRISFV
jgi:hypothetical protein